MVTLDSDIKQLYMHVNLAKLRICPDTKPSLTPAILQGWLKLLASFKAVQPDLKLVSRLQSGLACFTYCQGGALMVTYAKEAKVVATIW